MVDIPSDALVIAAGGRFRRQDGGELLKGSKMANDSGNAVFEKMFEQLPAYQRPIAVVFTGGSCNNKARQEHFDEYLKKAQAAMDKKGDGGKVGWKYLRTDDGSRYVLNPSSMHIIYLTQRQWHHGRSRRGSRRRIPLGPAGRCPVKRCHWHPSVYDTETGHGARAEAVVGPVCISVGLPSMWRNHNIMYRVAS